MKLYYSAGSCSTSCHILLEESGLKYEAIEVDWENSNDPNIAFVEKSNPLGTLPILITEEGTQLDQNLAIHSYIADRAPQKNLLPPPGTAKRAEAMNWLGFVNSDLHKSIGAMFSLPGISKEKSVIDALKTYIIKDANKYLAYFDTQLGDKDYVLGKTFSAADAYAFIVLGWTKYIDIPLTPYPKLQAYLGRIASRPAVAKVLKEEGLA